MSIMAGRARISEFLLTVKIMIKFSTRTEAEAFSIISVDPDRLIVILNLWLLILTCNKTHLLRICQK